MLAASRSVRQMACALMEIKTAVGSSFFTLCYHCAMRIAQQHSVAWCCMYRLCSMYLMSTALWPLYTCRSCLLRVRWSMRCGCPVQWFNAQLVYILSAAPKQLPIRYRDRAVACYTRCELWRRAKGGYHCCNDPTIQVTTQVHMNNCFRLSDKSSARPPQETAASGAIHG